MNPKNLSLPDDFSLEAFSQAFVSGAFAIASRNGGRVSEDFDSELRTLVSQETGISNVDIMRLHHPFYWVLFDTKDSIIERTTPSRPDELVVVRMKRPYTPEDICAYSDKVLRKHRDYLQAKVNRIRTLPQPA